MKNILLIDVDSKFCNPPLMKLSTYHKSKGDYVSLNRPNGKPDKVYISCIFSWNRSKALGIATMFPESEVVLGGSGINYDWLPDEIEHLCPDYELYGVNYSVGFVTRGCPNRCPWCVVPNKEGSIRFHAPLSEFLRHKKLILLDNNLLSLYSSPIILGEIRDLGIKTSFNQGLDIRFMTHRHAEILSKIRYYDSDFSERKLYFAWDDLKDEERVSHGIEILEYNNIPPDRLRFYMLIGYGVSPEEYTWTYFLNHDYYRFEKLVERGCEPYVMVYNNRNDIPILKHFKRWANMHIYGFVKSFENYRSGDSQKIIVKMRQ